MSNRGIGKALMISQPVVEKHITNIFQKLGLPPAEDEHRRVLAVLSYLRET
jgi:DNA-binding NarL/FixJ family response regulator